MLSNSPTLLGEFSFHCSSGQYLIAAWKSQRNPVLNSCKTLGEPLFSPDVGGRLDSYYDQQGFRAGLRCRALILCQHFTYTFLISGVKLCVTPR